MTVRRADGEGTYRQLEDGTWEGRITVGKDAQGRQRRVKRRAATRKELLARLDEARRLAGRAPAIRSSLGPRPTVAEWLAHWITVQGADDEISPTTLEGYVTDCEQYFIPAFGRRPAYRAALDCDRGSVRRHALAPA